MFTIVIDPGHGGKDSGASGSKVYEKDIALKIALKLGKYIVSNLSNIRVLYTRTTDKFVPLHNRVAIANDNNADIFFSIHCNAMLTRPSPTNGSETYVMGLHKAKENLDVAKRENKVVLLEQDYSNNYDGYDPNSTEGHIMLSMYQNAYLNQSLLLAQKVENQFSNNVKRNSRGVKQAGFVVLRTTAMPSVLVETGFLSNSEEENYLNSEKGQVYIASAMYRALKEYTNILAEKTSDQYKAASKLRVKNLDSLQNSEEKTKNVTGAKSPINTELPKTNKPILSFDEADSPKSYPANSDTQNTAPKIVYRVQLASLSSKADLSNKKWSGVDGLESVKVGNLYKCLVGKYNSIDRAIQSQKYWRRNGFQGAFIVVFKNGKKVAFSEVND
ncbi:MAG: N-acetylmuramoyl-L-alanine amidase [Saprospiraceae bacterium]|nr:N-acetylmuramoyl-L-alanine amidase [Saprospiraceae bacterium]